LGSAWSLPLAGIRPARPDTYPATRSLCGAPPRLWRPRHRCLSPTSPRSLTERTSRRWCSRHVVHIFTPRRSNGVGGRVARARALISQVSRRSTRFGARGATMGDHGSRLQSLGASQPGTTCLSHAARPPCLGARGHAVACPRQPKCDATEHDGPLLGCAALRHARCPTFVAYQCAVYPTERSNVRTKPELTC